MTLEYKLRMISFSKAQWTLPMALQYCFDHKMKTDKYEFSDGSWNFPQLTHRYVRSIRMNNYGIANYDTGISYSICQPFN